MRLKAGLISFFAALSLLFAGSSLTAQVAPAARVGGLPIGFGVGMSGYLLDYGPGRWMEGPVAWASVGVFHGAGVDFSARTIYINLPPELSRMQQSTFLLGGYYEARPFWHIRPFARYAGGIGLIEFPSRNPLYTRDTFTVYAPSGGVEIPIVDRVVVRAEYEYQFWHKYHGPNDLTPQGVTLGVKYYVRGHHLRPHPVD